MYLLVISLDTIDSLMGSNLNDFKSYAGDDADTVNLRWFDLETKVFGLASKGIPWKEDVFERGVALGFQTSVDTKVAAIVVSN